jgi:hypothetical protein
MSFFPSTKNPAGLCVSAANSLLALLPRLGDLHCGAIKRCGDKKTGKQACHSTLLMALSKTLSNVEGSRIEGLDFRFGDPCIGLSERFSLRSLRLCGECQCLP